MTIPRPPGSRHPGARKHSPRASEILWAMAPLDRIETRIAQVAHAVVIKTDAARDKVGVKVRLARGANKLGEITTGKRFAAGKTNLQHAERSGFANYAFPFISRELAIAVAAALWAAWCFA